MPSLVNGLPSKESGSRSEERVSQSIDKGLPSEERVSRSEESGFGFLGSKTQNAALALVGVTKQFPMAIEVARGDTRHGLES